jgi:hypothetical protein
MCFNSPELESGEVDCSHWRKIQMKKNPSKKVVASDQSEPVPVLLSPEEASAFLGPTVGTLATWRSTGRHGLPFIRVGNLIRYSRSSLIQWLASRAVNLPRSDRRSRGGATA